MIKNFYLRLFLFFIINFSMTLTACAIEQIRFRSSKIKNSPSHDYLVGLLKIALIKTQSEYGVADVVFSIDMQQARAEIQLQRGELVDIVSFGSSIERENKLLAIKIPVYQGVLGFRMSIIRKDFEPKFSQIKTLEDLKKYSACQGMHWPDSDILEAAGLKVIRNATYESLFRQVVAKRCDYFPRSVQEGPIEILSKQQNYPELMLYRHLILYYPYPAYFFVNKNNTSLHQRLSKDFDLAIKDGSFERHIRTHVNTKDLFPVSQWINYPTIELNNPLLSPSTDINNPLYWLKAKQ